MMKTVQVDFCLDDKVYIIYDGKPKQVIVLGISMYKSSDTKETISYYDYCVDGYYYTFHQDDVGKKVFLTRENALRYLRLNYGKPDSRYSHNLKMHITKSVCSNCGQEHEELPFKNSTSAPTVVLK